MGSGRLPVAIRDRIAAYRFPARPILAMNGNAALKGEIQTSREPNHRIIFPTHRASQSEMTESETANAPPLGTGRARRGRTGGLVLTMAILAASVLLFSACDSKAGVIKTQTDREAQGPASDTSRSKALPALDLAEMRIWDFSAPWHASHWNSPHGALPWRYDHVRTAKDGTVEFQLDDKGAPQLQATKGTPAHAAGLWQVDVTLPKLTEGVIVAPLWLYNPHTKDEIDFEFIGTKGLQLTVHNHDTGSHRQKLMRIFWGKDMSSRRFRLGIAVDQGRQRITMFVNGKPAHVFTGEGMGFFPDAPMRPWIEMWAIDPSDKGLVSWAGPWDGLGQNEALVMRVHGYEYESSAS